MGSDEPKTHRGLWYQLKLVVSETMRWPVATIVVITLVTGGIVALSINQGQFDPAYLFAIALSQTAFLVWGKSMMHLGFYAAWHKSPYPGSFLVATAIAMIPLFVFFASGFYLPEVQEHKFMPPMAIFVLFGLGYPFSTVFFAIGYA